MLGPKFAGRVANSVIVDTNCPFRCDFLFHRSVSEQLGQSSFVLLFVLKP